MIFAGAAFLTSIVCFVAGLRAALEARRKRAASKRAAGVVVALNRRVLSTGSAGVYCPTVEFSLPSGEVVRFDSSFGSLPASNSVGDAVQVSYDPASPQTAVIDAWLSHWLGPLVLFGFSVASGLAGLIMLVILIVESK